MDVGYLVVFIGDLKCKDYLTLLVSFYTKVLLFEESIFFSFDNIIFLNFYFRLTLINLDLCCINLLKRNYFLVEI